MEETSAKGVVVVTGGARGIGEAVSRHLATLGYHVIAAGNSEAEIAAFCPQSGIETNLLDVTDDDSVVSITGRLYQVAGPK